MQKRRI